MFSIFKNSVTSLCLLPLFFLSSCTGEEVIGQSSAKQISFETYLAKGKTRAAAKGTFAVCDEMAIYGYSHGGTRWSDLASIESGVEKKMHNNAVVKQDNNVWTYAPIQYWDGDDFHSFLAYYPYNKSFDSKFYNGVIVEYTTPKEAKDQHDFLYTTPVSDQQWAENKKISFTFRHALSQVWFTIKTNDDYSRYYNIKVKQVQIAGIKDQADLNLKVSDAAMNPWNNLVYSNSTSFTTSAICNKELSTEEKALTEGEEIFMLLPQTIETDQATASLTLEIEAQELGSPSYNNDNKVISFKIPATTWSKNNIYHYKITLNVEQALGLVPIIIDDSEIVDWETDGEATLPKDVLQQGDFTIEDDWKDEE